MASTKTVAKGIRIANECAEYFDGKPLNRMVESLMGLMESGVVTYDGEELVVNGVHSENPAATASVNTDISGEYKGKYENLLNRYDALSNEVVELRSRLNSKVDALADIEVMVGLFGLSLEKAIKDFDDLMNDGSISVTDGHLVCTLPDWAKRVEDVCHDRCIPLASMGKKITEMIERGQI